MPRTATAPDLGTRELLDDGRVALRFERRLGHKLDRIWKALTDPDQLRGWFPAVVDLDQPRGAELTFRPTPEQKKRFELPDPTDPNGEITRAERPHTLEYTWDGEILRWELQPEGGGSRLVFTNIVVDRGGTASIAAGWHAGLEVFEAQLDGRPVDWSVADRAEAMTESYERRFG